MPDAASPEKWWLYIVRARDGSLYTGITTDVARRFAEHRSGSKRGAKALRGKGPLELAHSELIGTRSAALAAEAALKKQSKSTKEAVVAGERILASLL